MAFGLIFNWDKETQQVRLVSGSPVYQNSVVVHTLTLEADIVLGNIVTATFYQGSAAITQSLTMHKEPDKNEWTLPLPDNVVHTAGTITVAFAILQPVVGSGTTTYQIITTGNQNFTVVTSVAQRVTEIVTPTEVENLQAQIDEIDQALADSQGWAIDLIHNIQPFIGPNNHWYTYNKVLDQMVDTGVLAVGQTGATGATGATGETGGPGPQGEKGADGVSVSIIGNVLNSTSELPDFSSTNVGDAYLVRNLENIIDMYAHTADTTDWTVITDWGGVPGPQGQPGAKGSTYFYNAEYSFDEINSVHVLTISETAAILNDNISICTKLGQHIAAGDDVKIVWAASEWDVKVYDVISGVLVAVETLNPIIFTAGGSQSQIFFKSVVSIEVGDITSQDKSGNPNFLLCDGSTKQFGDPDIKELTEMFIPTSFTPKMKLEARTIRNVIFDGVDFVCFGTNVNASGSYATSRIWLTPNLNAATWTEVNISGKSESELYSPPYYYFGLTNGEILRSTNKTTWNSNRPWAEITDDETDQVRVLLKANGTLLAGSGKGDIATSIDDGATWTLRTSQLGVFPIYGMAYGNGIIMCVASLSGSKVVISSDSGQTWTLKTTGYEGESLYDLAFINGKFYIGGYRKILYSEDGETWNAISFSSGETIFKIAHNENYILAMAHSYVPSAGTMKFWISKTGENWDTLNINLGTFPDPQQDRLYYFDEGFFLYDCRHSSVLTEYKIAVSEITLPRYVENKYLRVR